MKRWIIILLLSAAGAFCLPAKAGYPYEWLSRGITPEMSSSAVIHWRTGPESTRAVAQIAPATASPEIKATARTVEASSRVLDDYGTVRCYHTVLFEGLSPDSDYLYRIGDGGGMWSEWFDLHTASAGPRDFRFIYIADVQSGIADQYPRVIRRAYGQAPDAAFVVFTGDLTERALNDQYDDFFSANGWIIAQKPVVAVPDNHEYPKDGDGVRRQLGTWWDHLFRYPWNAPAPLSSLGFYTFDYQGCRLVMLNTRAFEDLDAEGKDLAFGWIEGLLRDNPCRWTVVVQHKPLYSVADRRHVDEDMLHLKSLYERYGVDLVISGHDHIYGRTSTRDGRGRSHPPVCVTSVAGSGMYPPSYSGIQDRIGSVSQFYQVVTVRKSALQLDTYDATGLLYDSFRIQVRGGRKKFRDGAPDLPERTALPAERGKKYDDASWRRLDSLRMQYDQSRRIR